MNDRAAFRSSLRGLAAVMLADDKSSATAHSTPTDEFNTPVLVKRTEEAKSAAPPKPTARKAKRPAAIEWLVPRLKNTKQVSIDLPPELDEMVERAACGQRMDKKFPGWKKEIHSVALVEWLERNGWFRPEQFEVTKKDDQDDAM